MRTLVAIAVLMLAMSAQTQSATWMQSYGGFGEYKTKPLPSRFQESDLGRSADYWDGDNEAYAQWSMDQDDSGTELIVERDDLMPASFIGSITLDRPDDDSVPNLVGTQPTGNYFKSFEFRFRLLPIAGGSTYIVQGLNVPYQGFCTTI